MATVGEVKIRKLETKKLSLQKTLGMKKRMEKFLSTIKEWREKQFLEQNRKAMLTEKLFEDSLVKSSDRFPRKARVLETQVALLQGRSNKEIKRAIEKTPTTNSVLVNIAASGHNLYRKDGLGKATQPLI